MHPLRRHIIHQLLINSYLKYSKLKPPDVEGNVFMYHLKQLIQEELIQKRVDGCYEFTSDGRLFADTLSLKTYRPRIQPKIVTLVICQNKDGQYLLYKRKREPFINFIGFPYGKIHLGETVMEAAIRELQEKTGIAANLKHQGDVYLTVYQDKNVISHMLAHVFLGHDPKGELLEESEIGKCFWEKIENPKDLKYMAGFFDVYELFKNPKTGLIFQEFVYQI